MCARCPLATRWRCASTPHRRGAQDRTARWLAPRSPSRWCARSEWSSSPKLLDGELGPTAIDDSALARLPAMIDEIALRTRFFDQAFLAAGASEVRQAVILASGLDARAYRLAWPAGRTVVYEID